MAEKRNNVAVWKCFVVGVGLVFAAGCGTTNMRPCPDKYTFIGEHEQYGVLRRQVYPAVPDANAKAVAAKISCPQNARIQFHGNMHTVDLKKETAEKLTFRSGMYPFKIVEDGDTELCGAMMFYNIDSALALATLGMTEDKVIFNENLLQKAYDGVLSRYTMQFENRDVLTYWLGNRNRPYTGGDPTVEVDFSGTNGISELRINGRKVTGFRKVIPVYTVTKNDRGRVDYSPCDYEIKLICDGKKYKGRLRKLRDNEFTAFVRIPCAIPQDLLDAARQGTVARYSIMSEGVENESRIPVAEILISGD